MRETQAWAEWELDILEKYYALHGRAYVQEKLWAGGSNRGQYSIRHKASRLGLSHSMQEFTPLADVAAEAGVSAQAVHQWVDAHGYRKHCKQDGKAWQVPAPVVSLYLHSRRTDSRPPGTWGSARAADHAGCTVATLLKNVHHVIHAGTAYFQPHDVEAYRIVLWAERELPAHHVPLADVVSRGERRALEAWLKANGHTLRPVARPGTRPVMCVHADHARAYLQTRLAWHEEQAATLLRKVQQVEAARKCHI